MSKQKILPLIREAVWLAYDKKCYRCSATVELRNMHIDHLIPEAVDNLEEVVRKFSLPPNFAVTDVRNLVASCQGCNLAKKAKTYLSLPIAMDHVMAAIGKEKVINKHIKNLTKIQENDPFLGHFVREDGKAEILVSPIDGEYGVKIQSRLGNEKFAFLTELINDKAHYTSDERPIDDLNDTWYAPYGAYFEFFGPTILVSDANGGNGKFGFLEGGIFAGKYRKCTVAKGCHIE